MTSMLRIGLCTVALAFTASTAALADDTMKKPMHHMHHGMMHKGKMGKMSKMGSKSEGDSAVAKLNEQSLQQAKAGAAPASMPASTMPASSGTMPASTMPASSGSMAPPASTSMPK